MDFHKMTLIFNKEAKRKYGAFFGPEEVEAIALDLMRDDEEGFAEWLTWYNRDEEEAGDSECVYHATDLTYNY